MLIPGFTAGGGITGPSSPGDIFVTPTISPTIGSPLRSKVDSSLLIALALIALVLLARK